MKRTPKLFSTEKGNAAAVVLIVIIIIIIVVWIVVLVGRECTNDSDCGEGYYCGSDNNCHEHRIIEKTVIQNQYDRAAYIIAFALIVGALILRFGKKQKEKK